MFTKEVCDMAYEEKRCPSCGAIYVKSDGYCKKCWTKLPHDEETEGALLNGIKKDEWREFIGDNADRFIRVFEKNKDKKVFLSFNCAAFFSALGGCFTADCINVPLSLWLPSLALCCLTPSS